MESYAQDLLDGTGVLAPLDAPGLKEAGNALHPLLPVQFFDEFRHGAFLRRNGGGAQRVRHLLYNIPGISC